MIKILIDSAADIGKEEADKLGVVMIPMSITFGVEEYYDGVNLTPNAFYEKLIESSVLPKTSLINSFRWEEAFEENLQGGGGVDCPHHFVEAFGNVSSRGRGCEKIQRQGARGR